MRTHVKQEDGRMHAYGWSLPANKPNTASSAASTPTSEDSRNANVPVPVPVYCRPLMEKEPGMKVLPLQTVDALASYRKKSFIEKDMQCTYD